jgi:hypothetical protein
MPSSRGDVAASLALELLTRDGALWVREASPSMLPLIRPGDELQLAPVGPCRIVRGMLVACLREPGLVVHRVVACDETGVVAKGDALASPDPVVPQDRVVARVVALRRPSGRLVNLEAFPWPLLNRLLGAIASFACRSPRGRLTWKALRLPFHAASLFLR